MRTAGRILSLAAAAALIAAPLAQASAEGRVKTHHKRTTKQAERCPTHRTAEGEIVDCHGWRLRDGDWDNTCFNLDYLPSQFACSSRSRR
jgi:hypothetical protein